MKSKFNILKRIELSTQFNVILLLIIFEYKTKLNFNIKQFVEAERLLEDLSYYLYTLNAPTVNLPIKIF